MCNCNYLLAHLMAERGEMFCILYESISINYIFQLIKSVSVVVINKIR